MTKPNTAGSYPSAFARDKTLRSILKVLISTVLLLIVLSHTDLHLLLRCFGQLQSQTILPTFLLFYVAFFVASVKWKVLLPAHKVWSLLRFNFIGHFYSFVLPGQVAGDAIKAYFLGKGKGDAEKVVASVLIDRLTGFIALLLVSVGGFVLFPLQQFRGIMWTMVGMAILAIAGIFAMALTSVNQGLLRLLSPGNRPKTRVEAIKWRLRNVILAWVEYAKKPGSMILSVAIGIGYQLTGAAINNLLGMGFNIHLAFGQWCWIYGLVSIAVLLPLSLGGLASGRVHSLEHSVSSGYRLRKPWHYLWLFLESI